MCRSKSQGGQRCSLHARASLYAAEVKVAKADAAMDAALANPHAPEKAALAYEAKKAAHALLAQRQVEYASTPEGHDALMSAYRDAPDGSPEKQTLLDTITAGDELKHKNAVVGALAQDKPRPPSPAMKFARTLEARFPGTEVVLSRGPSGYVVLHSIKVPKGEQGSGTGTAAMTALTHEADKQGWPLALTPTTDFGASSVKRLEGFYARHGFTANKGRARNMRVNETMVRLPR